MAKAYSADMRQRVIDRVESGASRREAAEVAQGPAQSLADAAAAAFART